MTATKRPRRYKRAEAIAVLEAQLRASLAELDRTFAAAALADLHRQQEASRLIDALTIGGDA